MKKLLLSLLLGSTFSFAAVINSIAVLVNDEPITTYDIERTMAVNKVDKNDAVSYLIDKHLYDQLVEEYNITADIFETNDYIEKLANSNGMDLYTFKNIIKQQYPDYSTFENEAKNAVIRQKLVQKLVKGNLAIATDEDMQREYEKDKDKYLTAKSFDIVQYASTNREALVQAIKNPMVVPTDVKKANAKVDMQSIPPQLQYILNMTKENTFTPIFTANKQYMSFFVTKKDGVTTIPFETVKAKIFNDIMMKREQQYLKDYFEKQKLTADIKVIR